MDARAELSFARCRAWLLNAYLVDLEAFASGDVNRFGRMVDGKGGSLGSESAWRNRVAALLVDPFVVAHCAELLAVFVGRAQVLGIEVTL